MKPIRITAAGSSISPHCPSTTCGGKEIKYPFWEITTDSAHQYCGYPGFGIKCSSSNNPPIINLPSEDFYVENIDYGYRTITLVDIDVTTDQNCPRARHNLTLNQSNVPLYLNSYLDFNLTFYFNCTEDVSNYLPFTYPVDCLSSGERNRAYVCLIGNNTTPWLGFCGEKVVATVKETMVTRNNGWVKRFGGALNEGFVLDWGQSLNCTNCEKSNGLCGFDGESDESLCFCPDGSVTNDVCKKGTYPFLALFYILDLFFLFLGFFPFHEPIYIPLSLLNIEQI